MPTMPTPMPPQSAPEKPNEGGGEFTKMVTGVSESLTTMQDLLSQEGVPPELTGKLGEINEQYRATLQEIMKSMGGGAPQQAKPPGGMVDGNGGPKGIPMPA